MCLLGRIPLLFLHGSPTKFPEGFNLRFGVCQTIHSKVSKITRSLFFFSSLWQPPMTSEALMLLKSQIYLLRAFQNGMTLAYQIKINGVRGCP